MIEAIKDYNWKWALELFYGIGAAAAVAVAIFVIQNNPFDGDPADFDTFSEWETWGKLALVAGGRAAWVAASSVTAKVAQKVLDALSASP